MPLCCPRWNTDSQGHVFRLQVFFVLVERFKKMRKREKRKKRGKEGKNALEKKRVKERK